jgi:hypothetical protein
MPYTPTKIYADHLPSGAPGADLVLPTADQTIQVQNVTLHNESAGAVNVKIFLNNGSTDLRLMNYDMTAGEQLKLSDAGVGDVVPYGNKWFGYADTPAVVTCLINGVVKT